MFLRISNPRAGDFLADLKVLANASSLVNVAGIVLPKADDADDIQALAKALKDVETKHSIQEGTLSILPLIETCLGLRNGFDIAKASPRVIGMALASAEQGDFMVDLGGRWTPRSLALTYPRSKLVVDARAAGVQWLVDGVFMNLKDTDMLREECLIARELGFERSRARRDRAATLGRRDDRPRILPCGGFAEIRTPSAPAGSDRF